MKENGNFIYGINLPWFGKSDNKYQTFGASPLSNTETTYSHDYADMVLTDISAMGFTSVRTWLFTGWGGTVMDSENKIVGLTDEFLDNLEDYLSIVKEKGLTANLVLVPHIVQNVPGGISDQTAAMHTILDEGATQSYIENALKPTLNVIKKYQDCVIALDLYCEPEGDAVDTAGLDTENYPGRAEKLSDLTPFIKAEADAVKSVMPDMYCLVSSSYNQNFQEFTTYLDYGIDILGLNFYNDESDVSIPDNRIETDVATEFTDRWITECNYKSSKEVIADWTEEKFSDIVRDFYSNAKAEGYSACYAWHYSASYGQNTSLVEGSADDINEPDLSKLRLSAQLLHYDIIDYNNSIGKTSGDDAPALFVNQNDRCIRWLGSRQAVYYQVEYNDGDVWQLLNRADHVNGQNLYEYTLATEYAVGKYPLRVVSYNSNGESKVSNILY